MTQRWSSTQINAQLTGGGTVTVTQGAATPTLCPAYGSEGFTTGKFYWETAFGNTISADGSNVIAGIGNTSSSIADAQWFGSSADTIGVYTTPGAGALYWNSVAQFTVTITGAVINDRLGHALDLVNNSYWWSDVTASAGTWWGSSSTPGNPAANSGGFNLVQVSSTITSHPVVPGLNLQTNGNTGTGFFASSSWLGTPPSGFGPFDPIFWIQAPDIVPPIKFRALGGSPT